MRTSDFGYDLPDELIAQEPMLPRDSCRLLVLDRAQDSLTDTVFNTIIDEFEPGDCLIVNETRVLPARLHAHRAQTGGAVELLLLTEREPDLWECLVKPGRKAREGDELMIGDDLRANVRALGEEGIRLVALSSCAPGRSVSELIHAHGEMPLPPYIHQKVSDPELYQTVFSVDEHSAAAPTAGLHFTPELLERIAAKGINRGTVRLDVGLGTFRPVTEEDPTAHHIHTEYYEVPQQTVDLIARTKAAGGRVIAVGTTATRALESAARDGKLKAVGEPTSLYILPGYKFNVVDALITNFHVPCSTLMMLVSAFATRDSIMRAYEHAVEERYRFLSFGDAMLIK